MKSIGFLFGNEKDFSWNIINKINSNYNSIVVAEPILIDITNNFSSANQKYSVIFDRFSNSIPFYHSVMKFLSASGIKVINSSHSHLVGEELSALLQLKSYKINVPRTAIIPSKNLPQGIQGEDMHNLKYPLNWELMFDKIGFPANIKSNDSNDLFDTYRVYNRQDFFFIYDMSDTKVLLYQEHIEAKHNIRIFVVGNNKTYLNYELHKAPKDRYSIFEEYIDIKTEKNIDSIIKTAKSLFGLDMFILDIAIDKKDKLYLLNINLFNMNIDNLHIPSETYTWLVDNTAYMLIDFMQNKINLVKEKEEIKKKKQEKKKKKIVVTDSDITETNIINI